MIAAVKKRRQCESTASYPHRYRDSQVVTLVKQFKPDTAWTLRTLKAGLGPIVAASSRHFGIDGASVPVGPLRGQCKTDGLNFSTPGVIVTY